MNDKVRIIGETFWIYAFCFPKKHYPTIEIVKSEQEIENE